MKVESYVPKFKIDTQKLGKERFLKVLGGEAANTWARLKRAIRGSKGADGQPIKASGYAPSYIAQIIAGKVKSKGRTKSTSATKPDLFISGSMLGSVQVKTTASAAEIFFNDTNEQMIASTLMDRGFENWFELGQEDLKRIDAALLKELEQAMEEAFPPIK